MNMELITCNYEDDNHEIHKWFAEIKRIEKYKNYQLIRVEGKGSAIDILVGRTASYNWICLPEMEVASQLSDWSDTFWNWEKLSRLVSPCDAITITNVLATLAKK